NLVIDWLGATIDNRQGGALAMVLYEEHVGESRIVLGPISKHLSPFPLPNDFVAYASTFMRDADGLITVVIQGRYRSSSSANDSLQFITLSSKDQGTTWSDPKTIWRSTAVVRDLGFYKDAQNTLHLVWTEDMRRRRHIYRSSAEWTESTVYDSSSEMLFPGVAGIDRCGRLTLIRSSLAADSVFVKIQLRTDSWISGSWVVDDLLKGVAALNPFDAKSTSGVWHVAWSGGTSTTIGKVWLARP
ncbi:MAG: hypothetical protein ACREX4_20760, partial [Gammaproteobacteria bacterium]